PGRRLSLPDDRRARIVLAILFLAIARRKAPWYSRPWLDPRSFQHLWSKRPKTPHSELPERLCGDAWELPRGIAPQLYWPRYLFHPAPRWVSEPRELPKRKPVRELWRLLMSMWTGSDEGPVSLRRGEREKGGLPHSKNSRPRRRSSRAWCDGNLDPLDAAADRLAVSAAIEAAA